MSENKVLSKIDNFLDEMEKSNVEYKPIKSPKKPFSYKDKWYTRDEMKKMGLDKEASKAITNESLEEGRDEEYEKLFRETAKKHGFDPEEVENLPKDKKKAFFDELDRKWKAKKETD